MCFSPNDRHGIYVLNCPCNKATLYKYKYTLQKKKTAEYSSLDSLRYHTRTYSHTLTHIHTHFRRDTYISYLIYDAHTSLPLFLFNARGSLKIIKSQNIHTVPRSITKSHYKSFSPTSPPDHTLLYFIRGLCRGRGYFSSASGVR